MVDGMPLGVAFVGLGAVCALILGPRDLAVQEEFLGSFLGVCKLSTEEALFGLALKSAGNGCGELGWELS